MPLVPVSPVGGNTVAKTNAGSVTIPNGEWQGNWQGRPAEVTQTDGQGFTAYSVFVIDAKWQFKLYLDSTDAAVAAGLVPGFNCTLSFILGGLGTCDSLASTTVFGLDRALNALGNEPPSVSLSGGGGVLTLNTRLP